MMAASLPRNRRTPRIRRKPNRSRQRRRNPQLVPKKPPRTVPKKRKRPSPHPRKSPRNRDETLWVSSRRADLFSPGTGISRREVRAAFLESTATAGRDDSVRAKHGQDGEPRDS